MPTHAIAGYLRLPRPTPAHALMRVLHWSRCWAEKPRYATGDPPEDYGQIRGWGRRVLLLAIIPVHRLWTYLNRGVREVYESNPASEQGICNISRSHSWWLGDHLNDSKSCLEISLLFTKSEKSLSWLTKNILMYEQLIYWASTTNILSISLTLYSDIQTCIWKRI